MDFEYLFALLCSGVVKGSIYALIALGYTMVYGIIQLINFAHGEVYMVGAFVALIITGVLTLSGYSGLSVLVLAAVIAVIYAAAYGYTLEKIAYRPLRNAPRLSPLISAIGFMAGIKAFTAAVLGGIGNIPGAVLGGLVLGIAETLGAGFISSAYEDVFAFGLLVLILILRPAGLLGKAVKQKV